MFRKSNLTKIIRTIAFRRKFLAWRNKEGETDVYVVSKHPEISLIAARDW
jgi:hypothetical protein